MVEFDVAVRKDNVPAADGYDFNDTVNRSASFSAAGGGDTPVDDRAYVSSTSNAVDQPGTSTRGKLTAISCPKHDFTGLVNQAMTCYLNSLLQTLFMTPEFRNAVYNWEFSSGKIDEVKSIPYQLQKLFLLLQTSEKPSLETKDLTRSFGWDSSHAWDQHDVQELCRVMFDALEHTWRKTTKARIINDLYQGTIKDYVKCLECNNENARDDIFLDLPLAVRPFGSQRAYASVLEALSGFVKPEQLEGSNQYLCSNCRKKCNAHKGLKITKFPYLLTIQLKRFDFDYSSMHRIKLNDRVTFPDILNLNPFVESTVATANAGNAQKGAEEGADGSTATTAERQNELSTTPPLLATRRVDSEDEGIELDHNGAATGASSSSSRSPVESEDFDPDLVNQRTDPAIVNTYLAQGPYVYELFSIMVHSGSANGGHYYAYIKDLDTCIWYCFNDQVVNRANIEDIRKTYGGSTSHYTYTYSSSTNAYMLMYRKIDRRRNERFVSSDQLPTHLINLLERLNLEDRQQQLQIAYEKSLTVYIVYYCHPESGEYLKEDVQTPKTQSFQSFLEQCHRQFNLNSFGISVDRCRLVRYRASCGVLDESLDVDWSAMAKVTVEQTVRTSMMDLLLEVRPEHVPSFRHYSSKGTTLHVYPMEADIDGVFNVGHHFLFYVDQNETVEQVTATLIEYKQWSNKRISLILENYNSMLLLDDAKSKRLSSETAIEPLHVYAVLLDAATSADASDESAASTAAARQAIERHKHVVRFRLVLPGECECREHFSAGVSASVDVDSAEEDDGGAADDEDQAVETHTQGRWDFIGDNYGGFSSRRRTDVACINQSLMSVLPPAPPPPPYTPMQQSSALVRYESPFDRFADSKCCYLGQPAKSPTAISDDDASMNATTPSPRVSPTVDEPHSPTAEGDTLSPLSAWMAQTSQMPLSNSAECEYDADASDTVGVPSLTDNGDPVPPEPFELSPRCAAAADEEHKGRAAPSNSPAGAAIPSFYPAAPSVFDAVRHCVIRVCEETETQRICNVECDGRMLAKDFKDKVASFIAAKPEQFKFVKVYGNAAECPWDYNDRDMKELSSSEGLKVKLGRVLNDNETLIKFYLFDHHDYQKNKFLFDYILRRTRSLTLEKLRTRVKHILERKCNDNVDANKIRFREVLHDRVDWLNSIDAFDKRSTTSATEIHVQILEKPDPTDFEHTLVFVRKWMPSSASYGGLDELLLPPKCTYEHLFKMISDLCHCDPDDIQVVKPSFSDCCSVFPFECSKLKLLEELKFESLPVASDTSSTSNKTVDQFPLYLSANGYLIYYRNRHEAPKELDDDERKEMQIRDLVRFRKPSSFSFHKERALKIYTEISCSVKDDETMDFT